MVHTRAILGRILIFNESEEEPRNHPLTVLDILKKKKVAIIIQKKLFLIDISIFLDNILGAEGICLSPKTEPLGRPEAAWLLQLVQVVCKQPP